MVAACLNLISYQEAVHTVSLAARSRQIANFVSSASKKEAPRENVNMEAKLRAWHESKGKTKSLLRTRIFSPSSIYCSKNSGSVKAKPKGRNLFDSGVLSTTAMEVVDMFGCGLPVCNVFFSCIEELVKAEQNGLLFSASSELADQFMMLCKGFQENCDNLKSLRNGALAIGSSSRRWSTEWETHALPLI